jgi:hypothetical protein
MTTANRARLMWAIVALVAVYAAAGISRTNLGAPAYPPTGLDD